MITFSWLLSTSPSEDKQILNVFLEAFIPQGRFDKQGLSTYFNQKIRPRLKANNLTYTAKADGKIIGFAIFQKWDTNSYYLAEMALMPTYQRQGLGKKLVFAIFEKDHHARKILLLTEKANLEAQTFYEKIGCQPSSFQHPDYPQGFIGYKLNR